jgi:hypothetical protein
MITYTVKGEGQISYKVGTNIVGDILLKVYDDYMGIDRVVAIDPGQITIDVLKAHVESLIQHITYVREAGEKIGVRSAQLKRHDWSKWGEDELVPYALHFQGGGAPDLFAHAWLHHLHYNPHHWQHWLFPDNFTPKGSHVEKGALPMPENYVKEMVADWMGASKAYTGSWDMAEWLNKNVVKMKLHSETALRLAVVLVELDYDAMYSGGRIYV